MVTTLLYIILVATAVWVYFDAKKIGARKGLMKGFSDLGPFGWFVCCVGLWIVAFPAYIIQRPKIIRASAGSPLPENELKQSALNTVSKFVAVGWTFLIAYLFIASMISIGDVVPTSGNAFEAAGFAIGTTFGLTMLIVIWFVVAIPATIVYFITKKSEADLIIERQHHGINYKTKACPFCAELIKEEAIFCRYCQNKLVSEDKFTDFNTHASESITGPPPPIPKPASLSDEGREFLKIGKYKEAIIILTRSIESFHKPECYYLRAIAYSKMRDRKKMIADLGVAAESNHTKAIEALEKIGKN